MISFLYYPLSKAPPGLSPNRATFCCAIGVRFKSCFYHIKIWIAPQRAIHILVRVTGLSSQLSNSPPDCSPNRATFCCAIGVRFKSCFYHIKIWIAPQRAIHILVRVTGLEPAHREILDPKSSASANSAILAYLVFIQQLSLNCYDTRYSCVSYYRCGYLYRIGEEKHSE